MGSPPAKGQPRPFGDRRWNASERRCDAACDFLDSSVKGAQASSYSNQHRGEVSEHRKHLTVQAVSLSGTVETDTREGE
ncbi:hypothetical protein [Azospirillum palustre]